MLLIETKRVANMNVIYIAHFTIKTILNLYNLLLQYFDNFLFLGNLLVK